MKSEGEMWGDLADRMNELGESLHEKLLNHFIDNRLNKDQIKKQIVDFNTASLKYYVNDVFIGMEEYELCQAFKEVLQERYNDPQKLRAYAANMIQSEMDAIESFRKIGGGPDIGSWDDMISVLEDQDIRTVFYEKYPLAAFIKLEMRYYRKRHLAGSKVFIEFEILENEVMPKSSLEYKLKMLYPDSHLKITANEERITLKCIDQSGEAFEQEYYSFEIVYEGEHR